MSAAKYNIPTGVEGEYEAGSRKRVLRNLLGITSKQAMDEAEFNALVNAQERYLDLINKDTVFTGRLLCQMDYGFTGPGSDKRKITYLRGVIEGYDKNYRTLTLVFREALDRATTR